MEYAVKTAEDYCECNSEFVQELMVAFERGARYALSNQWVDVKEALPEDDKPVFVKTDSGVFCPHTTAYYSHGAWCFPDDYYFDCDVTHWMPIPKLKSNSEKGAGK